MSDNLSPSTFVDTSRVHLTEEDLAFVQKFESAIKEENRISAEEAAKKADYKIQVWFRSDRSRTKPVEFTVSFWESGKRMHGGGDEMMFLCSRRKNAKDLPFIDLPAKAARKATPRGCGGIIPGTLVGPNNKVCCPHCNVVHDTEDLTDSIFYRCSPNEAGDVITKWWLHLKGNADIYFKYSPDDIRTLAMLKSYGPEVARKKRGLTIYPLANILKDTAAGKSLQATFRDIVFS